MWGGEACLGTSQVQEVATVPSVLGGPRHPRSALPLLASHQDRAAIPRAGRCLPRDPRGPQARRGWAGEHLTRRKETRAGVSSTLGQKDTAWRRGVPRSTCPKAATVRALTRPGWGPTQERVWGHPSGQGEKARTRVCPAALQVWHPAQELRSDLSASQGRKGGPSLPRPGTPLPTVASPEAEGWALPLRAGELGSWAVASGSPGAQAPVQRG